LPDTLLTYTANYGALRAKEIYICKEESRGGILKARSQGSPNGELWRAWLVHAGG
jgi:hypothetical protein